MTIRFRKGLGLAVLATLSLWADEKDYLPEVPGKVEVTVSKGALPKHRLSAVDGNGYMQSLTRLRDLIMAQPQMQKPIGVTLRGYFRPNDEAGSPQLPVPGFAYIRFHPMVKEWKTGQPVPFIVSTWEIEARVNVPCAGLQLMNEFEVPLYFAPRISGEVDGQPVYTVGSGNELLVFTGTGRMPWMPINRDEYAALVVEHWKKLAQDPLAASALQSFVQKYEAWRAAMTPEERRLQAWQGMENAPKGAPQGPLLVKPDPAWFDPALPRSAFQVITLIFDYSGDLDFKNPPATHNTAPLRVWQALHQSSWADLKSALTSR
jgi:hypothetical protein